MKRMCVGFVIAVAMTGVISVGGRVLARAQTLEAHLGAAKAAAGTEHRALFDRLCTPPTPRAAAPARAGGASTPRTVGPPARDTWHVPPAKVFANLYFVGEKEYSAWAVTTSEGIILV